MLFARADDGDGLAAVEHAVAGGAVADPAAKKLRLAGIELFPRDAGTQNDAAAHVIVAADGDAEGVLHRQNGKGPSLDEDCTGLLQLTPEELGHLSPAHGRKAGIIGDFFGFVQTGGVAAVADRQHGFPAVLQSHGGAGRRGASADENNVKHLIHKEHPFGAVFLPATAYHILLERARNRACQREQN